MTEKIIASAICSTAVPTINYDIPVIPIDANILMDIVCDALHCIGNSFLLAEKHFHACFVVLMIAYDVHMSAPIVPQMNAKNMDCISAESGERLCIETGCQMYREISSLTSEGLYELYCDAARLALCAAPPKEPDSDSSKCTVM
jgi:hypothetical protein